MVGLAAIRAGGEPITTQSAIAAALSLDPASFADSDLRTEKVGAAASIVAVIPELDDYLKPAEARERFAVIPRADIVEVEDGRHLWVGEKQASRVLSEIVERVNPSALPLPTTWP